MSYLIATCITWLVVLRAFNTVPMDAAAVIGICSVNALGFGMHWVIAEIVERVRPTDNRCLGEIAESMRPVRKDVSQDPLTRKMDNLFRVRPTDNRCLGEIAESMRPVRKDVSQDPSTWKVGDKFEVIGNDRNNHYYDIGDIVEFKWVSPKGGMHCSRCSDDDHQTVSRQDLRKL